jgi:hypothetical protein
VPSDGFLVELHKVLRVVGLKAFVLADMASRQTTSNTAAAEAEDSSSRGGTA